MAEKKVNPVLEQALEFGPIILFILIYRRIKDDVFVIFGTEYSGFIVATLALVPLLLIAIGVLRILSGKVSRMQIFTALLVIFFGALTAYFNDERFFKIKTTIVYGLFAVLLGAGLLWGRSGLQYVMGEKILMQTEGWMKFTRRMTAAFLTLAIGNEVVWRNMSTEAWVMIETFAFPAILIGFMFLQFVLLQKYLIEPDEKSDA